MAQLAAHYGHIGYSCQALNGQLAQVVVKRLLAVGCRRRITLGMGATCEGGLPRRAATRLSVAVTFALVGHGES